MTGQRWLLASLFLAGLIAVAAASAPTLLAEPQARSDGGDAAVTALVAELRALRADLAAASRNQLRAQMLLGRVQMQEQRLAYLDKQRSDAAGQVAALGQISSGLRNQARGLDTNGCSNAPNAETRRDCESMATMLKQQLADQDAREQLLRAQENELTNALAAEQARWSEFNSRLDELERSLR